MTPGSLHDFFTPDSEGRYWTEAGIVVDGPTFNFSYFGGLDTLAYDTEGEPAKIGIVWPGTNIEQYPLPGSFAPGDGSLWGSTVSATSTFEERSLANVYDDSLLTGQNGWAPILTNTRWWNIANLSRTADPQNGISALNGPAFIVKAQNGEGARTWQAWGLDELVGGLAGENIEWSDLEQKHMANTGVIVADIHDVEDDEDEVVQLLPVRIEEVSFWGDALHQLESDNHLTAYNAPHWLDKNSDGKARTDSVTGERNYPVAFTRETLPTVSAKLRITGLPVGREVRIRATSSQDLEIPETSVFSEPGGLVSLPPTASSVPLGDAIKFHDAEGETAFKINWEIRVAGGDWTLIGNTLHTVYITWADPLTTANTFRYETLYNLGCRNADGLGEGTSEQAIVDAIYGEFTDREVHRVKPSRGTEEMETLTYWGTENNIQTTADLLKDRDGKCGAWVRFFIDVLRAQGIDAINVTIVPPTPPIAEIQAALNAKFAPSQAQGQVVEGQGELMFVKRWDITAPPFAPEELDGIAAQGHPNPRSHFSNHALVEYNGKIYDPSYEPPQSFPGIAQWEDQSIDAFGAFVEVSEPVNDFLTWMWKPNTEGMQDTVIDLELTNTYH